MHRTPKQKRVHGRSLSVCAVLFIVTLTSAWSWATPSTASEPAPTGETSTTATVPETTSTATTVEPDESTTSTTSPEEAVDASALPEPPVGGWETLPMVFPVAGGVTFYGDWGSCRGGPECPREHAGLDIIAATGQPLLAAEDEVIVKITVEHPTAGNGLRLTGGSGWEYRYYHLNDQRPWVFGPGIAVGSKVVAGQVIGWVGQTGNASFSVPHLHFEISSARHS